MSSQVFSHVGSSTQISHITLPGQFWHSMMSEWMLCKGTYRIFRGGKSKGLLILPNHTGCLCETRKVEHEGNAHSPLQRMGRGLYLCVIFQTAGRIKLGKTALLAKIIFEEGVFKRLLIWLCLALVWIQMRRKGMRSFLCALPTESDLLHLC